MLTTYSVTGTHFSTILGASGQENCQCVDYGTLVKPHTPRQIAYCNHNTPMTAAMAVDRTLLDLVGLKPWCRCCHQHEPLHS